MTWGRGRKMGFEGRGPASRHKRVDSRMTQGGVEFAHNSLTDRVTCTMCGTWGGAQDLAFMLNHAKEHRPEEVARSASKARIAEILDQLGPDELAVVEEVAARLQVTGRASYGELKLDADQRDFDREADEELLDGFGYLAMAALQRRRRRQRSGGG